MKAMLYATISATVLTACGGSGGPAFITVPAEFNTLGDTDVDVALSPGGDVITVVKGGGTFEFATSSYPDFGTFRTISNPIADYTIAFVSSSESSIAGGAVYAEGADLTHGLFYRRIGETDLPTAGSATLTGDYFATLIDPSSGGSFLGLGFQGDLSLIADFEAETVAGTVTNRELINILEFIALGESSLADMTFAETDLVTANGSFAGTVTGGSLTAGGNTSTVSATSRYEGLIAGSDATEAVGATRVLHTIEDTQFIEVGSFAAGH